MNRRTFFKLMGIGLGGAVAAASLPSILEAPKTTAYSTYIMGNEALFVTDEGKTAAHLTLADIRKCVEELKSSSVKPVDGQFAGWVHPDREAEVAEWIRYKWNYQWTAARS